jgi:16S rRNA (cytosine967-C5)-methyltransferase
MELQKLSEHLALAKTINQLGAKDPDSKRLAHMLVCETARRRNFIDKFINHAIEPDTLDEYDLGVQAFLRLYVYQTRMARNWTRVDVEEAENISKQVRSILGWRALQRVEPILGFLLTQDRAKVLDGSSDEDRIALSTFHPTWFVKYCFNLFGRSETITMLEADARAPPTYVRLNALKADENEILKKLVGDGLRVEKVEQLRYAYKVTSAKVPITQTASFREGLLYIQDKASCFAAEVADPQPRMSVLDVCAAPGAKTTYLAQLMQNRGTVYSVDYSKRRMNAWKGETGRMGVEIAEPVIADACKSLPLAKEVDVAVLDPPCTSTGTFAKLPEAKWRLTGRSIEKMAGVQWQMLNSCAESLRQGGVLIYSTCSITVEENEMLIERFLKRSTDFSLVEIAQKMGLPGFRGLDKCQRLYPHIHNCNGLFISKLVKKG